MRYAAKITSKGQITIPKAVRETMGLEEGDYVVFEPEDDRIILRPAALGPNEDFEALADRIAERFERYGISRSDVTDAIRWARKRS